MLRSVVLALALSGLLYSLVIAPLVEVGSSVGLSPVALLKAR